MSGHLVIRADATVQVGTGHLMRCLTLAEAWREQGGSASFVSLCDSERLRRRVGEAGFGLVELDETYPSLKDPASTFRILEETPGGALILDGYQFDSDYQRRAKDTGHGLLLMDDLRHADHYWADVVVNQNPTAKGLVYPCEPYTQLLLGPEYALLRGEFGTYRLWRRTTYDVARRILVTMGGSDPDNATLTVMRGLARLAGKLDVEAVVVVGGANPHMEILDEEARRGLARIRLVRDAKNMAELMAWADVAVSGGGTTCLELAFMELPSVVIVLSDNQRAGARALHEAGVVWALGEAREIDEGAVAGELARLINNLGARTEMSRRGRMIVDGLGSRRVVEALKPMVGARDRYNASPTNAGSGNLSS